MSSPALLDMVAVVERARRPLTLGERSLMVSAREAERDQCVTFLCDMAALLKREGNDEGSHAVFAAAVKLRHRDDQ